MKKKYYGLQVLRFVAASFVVIDHAVSNVFQSWSNSSGQINWASSIGSVGVMVFFGISGFIMVITRYDSFGLYNSSLRFFYTRILRILPIYAIATSLVYLTKVHIGGDFNFLNYLKSLLFIPYINQNGEYRPILGQGWTLNYEMFFYLIFGSCLVLNRFKGILICVLFFIIVALFDGQRILNSDILTFYASRMLLYFVCGMCVALIIKQFTYSIDRELIALLFVSILMFLLVVGKVFMDENLFYFISLPLVFLCIYIGACCRSIKHEKLQSLLERLGDASYSTYLFHIFVLGRCKQYFLHYVTTEDYVLMSYYVIVATILANVIGFVCYKYVETPISKYLHNKFL